MQGCGFRSAVRGSNADEQIVRGDLAVLHYYVEVAALIEDTGIEQFEFRIQSRALCVLLNQALVGKSALRILIEVLHVRVRRSIVQIVVALFYIFTMISLRTGKAKEPFLQDAIFAIPERQGEAQILIAIAYPCDSIFAPAVNPRASMLVGKIVPGIAVGAVIFAHSTPCAFAEIWPPVFPVSFVFVIFLKTELFPSHFF